MLQHRLEQISYRVSYVDCGECIQLNCDQKKAYDMLNHCYCRHQAAVVIKLVLLSYSLDGSSDDVGFNDGAVSSLSGMISLLASGAKLAI